jgi:hypothetical protein
MASNSAYLSLPIEERLKILSRISVLELKHVDGVISTPEEMLQAMLQAANESGHRDIFLDCYGKQLLKQNWTKEESTSIAEGYIIRWTSKEYENVETDLYPYKKPVFKESGNSLKIQSIDDANADCAILNEVYSDRTYHPFWVTQNILDNAESEGLQPVDTVSHLIMPKTTPISRMTDATRQSIIESFSTLESDWYLPETRISELVKEIKNSVIENNWQGLHNFIQETRASVLKLRESNGQA